MLKKTLSLILISISQLLPGCSASSYSELLLDGVNWQFNEKADGNLNDFITKIYSYNKELGVPLDKDRLNKTTQLNKLNIVFFYWVLDKNNESQKQESSVIIEKAQGTLTEGELLFELHKKIHKFMLDQDHVFLEELSLVEEKSNDNMPTYVLWLGS